MIRFAFLENLETFPLSLNRDVVLMNILNGEQYCIRSFVTLALTQFEVIRRSLLVSHPSARKLMG